jgi:hypothetical protein
MYAIAAAEALALIAQETGGGPAQSILTSEDGVNKLIAFFREPDGTDTSKLSVKRALRALAVYEPAKKQMVALGILQARTPGVHHGDEDPFPGLI